MFWRVILVANCCQSVMRNWMQTLNQTIRKYIHFKPVRSQMKISYGRCSDTPHVSFSWSSVVNQSPPITEGSRRPSCLVVLRRFIGDFWSWILAVGHDICQIIQMLEFYGFFIKIFLTLVYLFQIRSVQQSAKALRLSAKERRLDSKLKGDTKTQHK